MTYAGRLDPMASGLLVILTGEETKNKEKYLALDKEYEFEILFGFATDTYDILGKVISSKNVSADIKTGIKNNIKYFIGRFTQTYPLYSSKTVNGRQLFEYGRSGVDIKLPSREIYVKKLGLLRTRIIENKKLLANIEKRIKKVTGDFRQKEILEIWCKKLSAKNTQVFFLATFKITCSSGTYVRGLANSLGERIGVPAVAFSIKRTKIGNWR
jgi:tRNA pseudouridine55 synthase